MRYEEIFRETRVVILVIFVIGSLFLIFMNDLNPATVDLSLGWDLQGGSELKVKTAQPLPYTTKEGTTVDMQMVVNIVTQRINGLGVKDFSITPWGDSYLIMDFAGTDPQDARELIERQGKLVVKIGNTTAFTGSELERVEPYTKGIRGSWQVPFTINQEAAERFRDVALETNFASVNMYLDGNLVNSAPIGDSLRQELMQGKAVKSLVLETGADEEAESQAKNVEIVLRSGALPIELNVISVSSVPPELGAKFAKNAAIAGFLAIVTIGVVIFVRYRVKEIFLPIIATGASEAIIILGFASLINWDLDLPSIAGIIAAVGTGVDDQIVITDEVLMEKLRSIKQRVKSAFFIIMSAWFATVAAMFPLFVIGLTALKGFAFTTIVGVTVGVFITRPAFARVAEHLLATGKRR